MFAGCCHYCHCSSWKNLSFPCSCVDNHDVVSMRVYDLDELPDEGNTESVAEVGAGIAKIE